MKDLIEQYIKSMWYHLLNTIHKGLAECLQKISCYTWFLLNLVFNKTNANILIGVICHNNNFAYNCIY